MKSDAQVLGMLRAYIDEADIPEPGTREWYELRERVEEQIDSCEEGEHGWGTPFELKEGGPMYRMCECGEAEEVAK